MKKSIFSIAMIFATSAMMPATAGGFLTNTNQNVTYLRNAARGASTEIDAVYTNPAGLAFLEKDGFHFSLNNQSAFQTRTIESTFDPFELNGGSATKTYKGKATAPFIPSLQVAYKKDNWTISGSFAITGGGGTLLFDKGLPTFEAQVAGPLSQISEGSQASGGPSTGGYALDMRLEGSSVIYGVQLGTTYKINDMFSAFFGGRMSIVNNSYEGYLRNVQITGADGLRTHFTGVANTANSAAKSANGVVSNLQGAIDGGYGNAPLSALGLPAEQLAQMAAGLGKTPEKLGTQTVVETQSEFKDLATYATGVETQATDAAAGVTSLEGANMELNTKQSGFGFAPIIGFDFKWNKLNIGVKYEFVTKLYVENKTKEGKDARMFIDGEKILHDIPALFTFGASYEILPVLRASAGCHYFFDKQAKMADDKQEKLDHGTYEVLFGLEWDITKRILVSGTALRTQYGVTDDFQSDMSFSLSSFSYGIGGAVKITDDLRVNLAYLISLYDDYTKKSDNYNKIEGIAGTDVFKRTNHAFGIGLDYRF